jgi:hypothetical protein
MKVRVQPATAGAVGMYRVTYPANAVEKAGLCDIERPGPGSPRLSESRVLSRKGDDALLQMMPGQHLECDVLVVQRLAQAILVDLIPKFQLKGIAVVVDVDDDLAAVHANNQARGSEDHRQLLKACALADLVTVTTPALAKRYGGHGRVKILPNCVPQAMLDLPDPDEPRGKTVGWAGWAGVHPDDLQTTNGGVAQAVADTAAQFLQVGPVDGIQRALGLSEEPAATGPLELEHYQAALGALAVGIAPLRDTAFNNAKSALKPLEMTARGAAVVMSPRYDYARIHEDGIGMLAGDRSREWRRRVRWLLEDDAAREELVAQGREAIAEHHTYEGNCELWADAWAVAAENHAKQSRKIGLAA